MNTSSSSKRSPLTFFVLVFALAIPFWLLGGRPLPGPLRNLPVSALQTVVPLIAASILVYREEKFSGIRKLLKRVFDYKSIKEKIWYVPIIFLLPLIYLLAYGVMRLIGLPIPEPLPFLTIPLLFVLFFIGAVGEELGWTGYAIDPMQDRWNALQASILLGLVWAIFHLVPLVQAQRSPAWIAWWVPGVVGLRILIVWLYNNTGKSVFAAILFHAIGNVSNTLVGEQVWPYPFGTGQITAITAVIVTFLWGSKTLARYRYAATR